jgi:2-polyprenyl-6-methoxyphenol hydroxylase-like FAD-dependent oxidoreductase
MIAAYVLAGELAKSSEHPEAAFRRYEQLLHGFMQNKQKAAEGFARSIVPKTALGVFFRNQITKGMAIPGVAKLTMASSLLDQIDLPEYSDHQQ